MKHTENEVKSLKNYHIEMWNLVQNQVSKAFDALRKYDKELAREVLARERVVNAQELVVDHHCEDFIALFAPVAVDLRFVISLLKITNNLERIGDFAESIARYVNDKLEKPIPAELYDRLALDEMMSIAESMLSQAREALINENAEQCGKILAMDDAIDQINAQAENVLTEYIQTHPEQTSEMLRIHALIRRIERVGDRTANIVEDIVFFVDAKELRHSKKP